VPLLLAEGDFLKYKALFKEPIIPLYEFFYKTRIDKLNSLLYKIEELKFHRKLK